MPGDERRRDHERNTELLNAELPDPRFVDHRYLEWLYDENPHGPGITESVDDEDDGRRVAHYGLIPQEYRDASGPAPFVFSLNAVTRSGIQRKGYFTTIARKVYARAAEAGYRMVIGVSNENSTPPVVEKLGWRLYCPLPVVVALRSLRRPKGWDAWPASLAVLASDQLAELAGELDRHPAEHWTNRYTLEHLRWRLASPNSPGFVIHVGPDLVAISTKSHAGPVPMAVLLKLLPRNGDGRVLDGRAAVAAVAHHHRAAGVVYAGWNRWVRVRGVAPPRRILPAPLNLIVKSLDPAIDQDAFTLDTYEFLDMDAY